MELFYSIVNSSWFWGATGLVVTIIAAYFSYHVTQSKEVDRRRRESRKATVEILSRMMGEDAVPSLAVVDATRRSVLRDLDRRGVRVSNDEMIRQVAADPYLDAARRKKLHDELSLLAESDTKNEETIAEPDKTKQPAEPTFEAVIASAAAALLAALASLLAATKTLSSDSSLLGAVDGKPIVGFAVALGLALAFALAWTLMRYRR